MALTEVRNVIDITADTMADLLVMEHKAGSVQLLGFHSKGDGGGGVFYWDATQDKANHNGGTIIDLDNVANLALWDATAQTAWFTAGTGTGCWVRAESDKIKLSHFGAKGDGVTDETLPLQNAISYATSASRWTYPKGSKIYFESGQYLITANLQYNPQLVSLVGNHTTLDFSGLVSGTAIWLRGEGTAGESFVGNRYKTAIDGIKLIGNSTITLVDVFSDSGTQDSRGISLRNVFFDQFAIGINLSKNGWALHLENYGFIGADSSSIHINEVQDDSGAGITNFGEMNSFSRGMHSGAGTAYKSRNYSSDGHMHFVSFDCEVAVDIAHGAKLSVHQFHIESGYDGADMFVVEGDASGLAQTTLNMKDGTLHITGSSKTYDYFACGKVYTVGNGGINIDGLTLVGGTGAFNWTQKSLIGGTGNAKVRNLSYQYQAPAITLSGSMSAISNGGFETGTLGDWSPFDPSYVPVISATTPRTGTYCMALAPVGAAIVGVTKTEKIAPMQKAFFGLFYKLEAVVNGGAAYQALMVRYTIKSSNGTALKSEERYFEGTSGYTYFSFNTLSTEAAPKGADSITVEILLYQATSGIARVDDVVLNIIE